MITIIEDNILNASILIVDDNPSNILLLQRLLTISGYRNIKSTTKSIEVLDLYKTYQPDLLLMDLRMPPPDGFEIIEQLNRIKGDDYLPVIIITAQNDQECRLKALKIGAKDFIAKPFDHAEILMRIKNMLEMRLLHKEVRDHRQKLEDKVQKRTKKLQDLQVELIHRLGRAAEFRDHGTWSHIRRICMYTFELGKSIDLPDEECQLLLYASTMHDIGKIGIPDEILFKAGPLDQRSGK
ncbi:hypothetical protein N752_27745 [Desulforamulus aquiferis]|nr:hypothetical protein N752_27745 [Desulforamulus aquiferis]